MTLDTRQLKAIRRRNKIYQLRKEKYTYKEIAQTLRIGFRTVTRDMKIINNQININLLPPLRGRPIKNKMLLPHCYADFDCNFKKQYRGVRCLFEGSCNQQNAVVELRMQQT